MTLISLFIELSYRYITRRDCEEASVVCFHSAHSEILKADDPMREKTNEECVAKWKINSGYLYKREDYWSR